MKENGLTEDHFSVDHIIEQGLRRAPSHLSQPWINFWALNAFSKEMICEQVEQLNSKDIVSLNNFYEAQTSQKSSSLAEAINFTLKAFYNTFPTSIHLPVRVGWDGIDETMEHIISDKESDFTTTAELQADTNKLINSSFETLTKNERATLFERFFGDKLQVEIARDRGVTRTSVGQAERKGIRKLKEQPEIENLRVYLD